MASSPNHAATEYRPDVDGLRAVAVSAVLLFHAFPLRVPGGFVGVDIFFIISGYLISGILFKTLQRGTFSFADFYSRRIRRIFPALALLCAACLAFGWFSLLPEQFRQLGKHVLGGAAFSSNFVLLNESGYFDVDSAQKPLRHLWSLGIEEQYYLVWPLLLFALRNRSRATEVLLVTLALVSFAFNLYLSYTDRSMAYYLPLTRFWELMLGSGLAYMARDGVTHGARAVLGAAANAVGAPGWSAQLKSIVGAIAIVLALVLIDERRAFPGWWALLPCGGAVLLISAGPAAWINRNILASRLFVWVGLISYPLYLWHWPLLSFANIMSTKPSIAYRVGALVASVILSWLTYRFVELPIRHGRTQPQTRRNTMRLAQAMLVVALVGLLVGRQIIPSASARDPMIASISQAASDWESIDNEIVPGDAQHTVLFFGDSHMEQYWPRVEYLTQQTRSRRTVEFRTMGGCAPLPGIERRDKRCVKFVTEGLERASKPDVDIVVLAAQWSGLVRYSDYYRPGYSDAVALDVLAPRNAWVFEQFSAAVAQLRQQGKQVVVLLSSPNGDAFDPKTMVDYHALIPRARLVSAVPRAELANNFSPVDSRIDAAARQGGAQVLDPLDWFCNGAQCPVQSPPGRPVSKDGSHMCASVVRARVTALDQFVLLGPLAASTALPQSR
jgi:peptidoglycan/LPS O-acetylase OafA/YrhL